MASTYSANGTVSMKDTNYAILTGVYFVSNAGSDSNPGTQASPWLTVGHAISAAPSGSTIVLRGGTYREGGLNVSGKQLTLQAFPHEQAWLKGSAIVTGWTQFGNCWMHTGWTTQFGYSNDTYMAQMIDPNHPLAGWPDMVFVNGVLLTCAHAPNATGGQASVRPGTFYIDYANKTIYIGDNPSGAIVEVAQYQNGLSIHDGCEVLGLGFQHYASSYKVQYAFNVIGANCVVENNTVAYCATGGMNLNIVTNCAVHNNTCAFNGEQGMAGYQVNESTISANYFAYNNTRSFTMYWDAAGFKIFQGANDTISNNTFDTNNCHGLWIDGAGNVNNITIVGNTCMNNASSGIHYEYLCSNGIIANNLVVGSGDEGGIVVGGEATNVQVWNNTLIRNNPNIHVTDDNRSGSTSGIVIRNNILSNGGDGAPNLLDVGTHQWAYKSPQTAASSMVSTCDYNVYYRTGLSAPAHLVDWSLGSNAPYATMAAFHNNTGNETHGIELRGGANPFFVDEAGGNYTLKPGSPAIGAGVALPTNIAAAIGVAAGVPVNMGALTVLFIKQTPVVTWAAPAAITQGTAVSTVQLDATANVPGSFTYSPVLGTVLPAGTSTLTANFTPTDTTDYTTATATVNLTVNISPPRKLVPVITWAMPQPIIFGTGLSILELNATASYNGATMPGTFTYSPSIGAVLQHGPPSRVLNCTFTPTDTTTYATVTATTTIDVWKAHLITW